MRKRHKNEIEILAPAGSIESMKAAFGAGADAVYMGGSRFGARAFAHNPNEDDLKKAIDYAHIHEKKLYLTMNTLFKEKELVHESVAFLKPYYEHGLDAVIVQDFGFLALLKNYFKDLPIHASTQMTITGYEMARWLQDQGVERVVPSRELSLSEIKKIAENTDLEIEVFVQGALCYCYSGQCLMSSFIGGRSGNRGRCAQPCRLPYTYKDHKTNEYLLSPKDINTLKSIPDLIDAGVYSFKIEGRMKKPEYAGLTSYLYRYYADQYLTYGKERYHVNEKDIENLMDLYNRGGFSRGYLYQHNGADMIFTERPNHMGLSVGKIEKNGKISLKKELHNGDVLEIRDSKGKILQSITWDSKIKIEKFSRIKADSNIYRMRNPLLIENIQNSYLLKELKEKIEGYLTVIKNEPLCLSLDYKDQHTEIMGEIAQEATNLPMTEEQLRKQISKTGNTPFEFHSLDVYTDGACYIPNRHLNELRRQGLELLERKILGAYRRTGYSEEIPDSLEENFNMKKSQVPYVAVKLFGEDIQKKCDLLLRYSWIQRVYLEIYDGYKDGFQYVKELKNAGIEVYFSLPYIYREKDRQKVLDYIQEAKVYADGWLVHHLEYALLLKKYGESLPMVFDSEIYALNHYAKTFLIHTFKAILTAPVELNYNELKQLGCQDMELTIYGHQSLMISAQCIKKTVDGCTKTPEMLILRDRQQKKFYVYNDCTYCYNRIFNGLPTVLMDKFSDIQALNPKGLRLSFTVESLSVIENILDGYASLYIHHTKNPLKFKEFTRGHFTRGIE